MRFPFITRRAHEAAVDFLAALHQSNLSAAEKWAMEERGARRTAEELLESERDRHQRAKRFIVRQHGARYDEGSRLTRALRAVAQLRAEAAVQRRVIARLTDQLLDATGYQGEELLPEARRVLDIDAKEADA